MTFNDIFKSNFLENVTTVSVPDMALTLVLAFGVGLFIFLVYKKERDNTRKEHQFSYFSGQHVIKT